MLLWILIVVAVLIFAVLTSLALHRAAACPLLPVGDQDDSAPDSPEENIEPALDCVCDVSEEDRIGYLQAWHSVRERFDSDPKTAVTYADLLTSDLMRHTVSGRDRTGPPPNSGVERKFGTAHNIAVSSKRGAAMRADLELAMRLYGAVFSEVLHDPSAARFRTAHRRCA